jgi:carbonic anhydrase
MLDAISPTAANPPRPRPDTPAAAIAALVEGNRVFGDLLAERSADGAPAFMQIALEDLGLGHPGVAPPQEPFAAFLGCADARAPVELLFGQAANNLFVVRVAGNILDAAELGSLNFAVERLGTVRLLCVLGHTGCGAVTAAVDAYLVPASYLGVAANLPLQAVVSPLMAPVRGAAEALRRAAGDDVADRPGYRAALVDLTGTLHAALEAAVLRRAFHSRMSDTLDAVYGVYNLATRRVGRPNPTADGDDWQPGLFGPPDEEAGFARLADTLARSPFIRATLDRPPTAPGVAP